MNSVTARAPGKVNLLLRVGPLGADGYHPLVTVFQAVDLYEQVTATALEPEAGAPAPNAPASGIRITASGPGSEHVPLDQTNLAYKAAAALAARLGIPANVALHIVKGVPVAGGMAGGSADAAATLVACNELWGGGLSQTELLELAAALGSDVPFSLMGGTAIGTGRGHLLTPIKTNAEFHWAFAIQSQGLSTPKVFQKFDQMLAENSIQSESSLRDSATSALWPSAQNDVGGSACSGDSALLDVFASNPQNDIGGLWDSQASLPVNDVGEFNRHSAQGAFATPSQNLGGVEILGGIVGALEVGDIAELAGELVNDLQAPALALRPELANTIEVAKQVGALGVLISGSGPTVAALAPSGIVARQIAKQWQQTQTAAQTVIAKTTTKGAHLI